MHHAFRPRLPGQVLGAARKAAFLGRRREGSTGRERSTGRPRSAASRLRIGVFLVTSAALALAGLVLPAVTPQASAASPGTRLQIRGSAGLRYSAAGLPPGLAISPSGLISGTGAKPGTSTVTVTGKSATGASTTTTFIWTVS